MDREKHEPQAHDLINQDSKPDSDRCIQFPKDMCNDTPIDSNRLERIRQHDEDTKVLATSYNSIIDKLTEQDQKALFHTRCFTVSRSLVTIM